MEEFTANSNLINKQLAERSHTGTSFSPERRADQELEEFTAEVQAVYDRLKPYAKTDSQKELLISEMQRFQASYAEKYNDKLAAHGRCISSFITGASNFPTRRAEKANNSYDKKWMEMIEFKERAEKAILRELKKLSVEAAGGEIAVLSEKIQKAEESQEKMKLCNAVLRKKNLSDQEKVTAIMEKTRASEVTARKMLIPDFCGRVGFSYHLTNNNANIKRMKERLIELQEKEATPTSELTFQGGNILDNAEMDRVQILFDEKPPQEMINRLKAEGWRWSPANMAWQRKRTAAAIESAKRITEA